MSIHSFIKDFQANQFIEGVYAVQNLQQGVAKSGKPYLKCLFSDKTGQTAGRMWSVPEGLFDKLPTDGFVFISGTTQAYQGSVQIIIEQIRNHVPEESELLLLLPSTKYDIDTMFGAIFKVVETFEDPAIKALAMCYLNDEALMAKFKQAPAAMSVHHAYLGGLLEHTLSLLRLAHVFCPLYPQLNRDIVMMGLLLHDIGKCSELTWEKGFGYSTDGQLIGHIARGVIWLEKKAKECEEAGTPVPELVLQVLHHIILSHHGIPEHGALKIPATPEAIAVSLLDNVDAKLNMALGATRSDEVLEADANKEDDLASLFTDKIWALDARLLKPDPVKYSAADKKED